MGVSALSKCLSRRVEMYARYKDKACRGSAWRPAKKKEVGRRGETSGTVSNQSEEMFGCTNVDMPLEYETRSGCAILP